MKNIIFLLLLVFVAGCLHDEGGMTQIDPDTPDSLRLDNDPDDSAVDDLTDIVVLGVDVGVEVLKCEKPEDCKRCRDNGIYTQDCINGVCQGEVDLVKQCAEDEVCTVTHEDATCVLTLTAAPAICKYCEFDDDGNLIIDTLDIREQNYPKDLLKITQDGNVMYWNIDETNPNNRILEDGTLMVKGIPLASMLNPLDVLKNPNPNLQGDFSNFTDIPYEMLEKNYREVGEFEGSEKVKITYEEYERLFNLTPP